MKIDEQSVLPDYLLEQIPSYEMQRQAKEMQSDSSSEKRSFGLGDIVEEGKSSWRDLKEGWDYMEYSDELESQYKKHYSPEQIYRYIFDVRGRAELPNADNLVLQEGGSFAGVSEDAVSAYINSGIVFDFFQDKLGFNLPQPLIQVVHYDDNEMTVGFNNAHFNMGAEMMVYGSGDGKHFTSFAKDLTVVAHEVSHYFLETMLPEKFPYLGQSGAINEHFADVIGKCTELSHYGYDGFYTSDMWKIGASLMIEPNQALRDMLNPGSAYNSSELGKDPQPAHMKDFKVMKKDMGGVHVNSGILNKLFVHFVGHTGLAAYEEPLKIWLRGMVLVDKSPSFLDFANALRIAAREYNMEEEFMMAATDVGIFDYVVMNDEVVYVGDKVDAAEPYEEDHEVVEKSEPQIDEVSDPIMDCPQY